MTNADFTKTSSDQKIAKLGSDKILQLKTLQKMKSYNVDVGNFIRDAISEKIKKEYQNLIPKTKKEYCPF